MGDALAEMIMAMDGAVGQAARSVEATDEQVDFAGLGGFESFFVEQPVQLLQRRLRALLLEIDAGDVDLAVDGESRLGIDEQVGRVCEKRQRDQQQRQLPQLS